MKPIYFTLLCAALSNASYAASNNYEKRIDNDDGSVTLISPKFVGQSGKDEALSEDSDAHGLCALYGFRRGVQAGLITTGDSKEPLPVIGKNATFLKYQNYNSHSAKKLNGWIVSAVCTNDPAEVAPSKRASFSRTDDGNTVITNPEFGQVDGLVRPLSSDSNLNGVCRLFGLGNAISSSVRTTGDCRERTVIIGETGQFAGFETFNSKRQRIVNDYITSLICYPKPEVAIVDPKTFTDRLTTANLESAIRLVANQMYSQRKDFLDGVATQLARTSDSEVPDYERVPARLFVIAVLDIFMRDIQSAWFQENVAPVWNRDAKAILAAGKMRSIREISASPTTTRQALGILHEGFKALKVTLGNDADLKAVDELQKALGIAIANTLRPKDQSVSALLSKLEAHAEILTRLQANPRTAAIAASMGLVVEYLQVNY